MERLWLTLAMIGVVLLAAAGLWWGWRNRAARQSDLPDLTEPPSAPSPDLIEPLTGLYVSTTVSGRWQDRPDLTASVRGAVFATFGALAVAALALWKGLASHDFNIEYVAAYTSRNLPDGYIISQGGARTNITGVFHAGDVQDRTYRQAITASGAGCMAAIEAERFLEAEGH